MFRNIIFDFGNVLIKWDCHPVYDRHFQDLAAKEKFFVETQIQELNLEFDRGLPFTEGLTDLARKFPHYHDPIWMWKHSWVDMLGPEIAGSIEVLQELRQRGYALYGLTNWADETFIYAEENLEFLNCFVDIVVSGREKLIKPQLEIYQLLLNRNNLIATESIFIDDKLINVEAAQKIGITGIHFQSPQQLRAELEHLKVL